MRWKMLKTVTLLAIALVSHSASAVSLKDLSCIAKMCLGGDKGHGQCLGPIKLVDHYARLGKKSWFLGLCPFKETDDPYAVQREQWRLEQGIESLDPANAPKEYQRVIQQRESDPQYLQILNQSQKGIDSSVNQIIDGSGSSASQTGIGSPVGQIIGGSGSSLARTGIDSSANSTSNAEIPADELRSKIEAANTAAIKAAEAAVAGGGYSRGSDNRSSGSPAGNSGGSTATTIVGAARNTRCEVYTIGAGLNSLSISPLQGESQSVPATKLYKRSIQQGLCRKYAGKRLRVELFEPVCSVSDRENVELTIRYRLLGHELFRGVEQQQFVAPVPKEYSDADRCRMVSVSAARRL